MADPIVNFFKSTLVGTYSDADTSLTIATGDGSLLPDPATDGAYNLTIFRGLQVNANTAFEIVRVTAKSGDVLTVTREQEGTTALTVDSEVHSILMSATKKTFDDINDAIDNVDLTTLTGVEELTFDSTGNEEFGLPAGTTAQRPASPSAGYMRYNTETAKLEVYSGGMWGFVSLDNVRALDRAEATANVNSSILRNIPVPIQYVVIAGGGGAGFGFGFGGSGGGGAGGYRSSVTGESSGGGASAESILELSPNTNYTVTVGAGGNANSKGSDSVLNTITSEGGGRGGDSQTALPISSNGGSGGGPGGRQSGFTDGGTGASGQGFSGGSAFANIGGGNGGGGASQAGASANSNTAANGGDGVASSITGSSVTRGGGGAGGRHRFQGSDGVGGAGGGGNSNTNGAVNTGGGGGGCNAFGTIGLGGSGVVILRYPSQYSITIGAGLTGSETTDGNDKYAEITAGTGNVSWTTA